MQLILQIYINKIIGFKTIENASKFYITYNDAALNIRNGNAEIFASIKVCRDIDCVSISIYLQRYDEGWSTVKYWIKDFNNTSGLLNFRYDVNRRYKYRILMNFYAYCGDYAEWISVVANANRYELKIL